MNPNVKKSICGTGVPIVFEARPRGGGGAEAGPLVLLNIFRACIRLLLAVFIFMVFFVPPVQSALKQRFGGNLRVAEELLTDLNRIYWSASSSLSYARPMSLTLKDNTFTLDLTDLPDDQRIRIIDSFESLQNNAHPCHWMLDYPYLDHRHRNSTLVRNGKIVFQASEPEFLSTLLESYCVLPGEFSFLMPFRKTQFGYEANLNCPAGRPFLDSISPVTIDPINPYLAFKLDEVDVFPVPETKFQEISADMELSILPGPKFLLYLRAENLTQELVETIRSAIDAKELARSVLNDHAEILIQPAVAVPARTGWRTSLRLQFPDENPFRLIGERLKVQLEDAGLQVNVEAVLPGLPLLQLIAKPVRQRNQDLLFYQILREDFQVNKETTWFEEWDELEAAGRLMPLLLYQSRIAVKKNIMGVEIRPDGTPDFSNCWVYEAS